jgi:transforming growth factor-beta-induced protein
MSRTPRFLAALCALSLVATACGGDDDAAPVTTEVVEETTTTEQPETTEPAPETTETTEAPETTTTIGDEPVFGTIIEVAEEAGSFTILLAAVEAAGLTETLATRTFTVLAPTDEAFEALGQEAIDALLADTELLTSVLLNHLLPLAQTTEQIALFNNVIAAGGSSWPVDASGEQLNVGGANVIAANIETDNGFIQVIDTVLLPAAEPAE